MPKGEANASKTHCPKGHEYSEENTQWYGPDGRYRRCIACKVARNKGTGHPQSAKTHCKYGHEFTDENTYRHGPDNKYRTCRTCALDRAAKAYRDNPERFKVQRRKHIYGLSPDDLQAMWVKQSGVCPICRTQGPRPEDDHKSGVKVFWRVDHDHNCCPGRNSCGACVRGLLCTQCNQGLGFLRDDIDAMQRAIDYLRMSDI